MRLNTAIHSALFGCILILYGCNDKIDATSASSPDRAQEVVDSAIAVMGGDILEHAEVSFRFRVRDYIYRREDGKYTYTRVFEDTTGTVTTDILTNSGLTRTVNGDTIQLDSTWTSRYANSVNSVIYFAFLPYRLNDLAVIKTYNGVVSIKDREYHEVLIQFREEGGGKDHDDNFLYWFDTGSYALDYFAYDYITDGGGVRFREAFNRRNFSGLVLQDYINYKPAIDSLRLKDMRTALQSGQLTELSRIELVDVKVVDL